MGKLPAVLGLAAVLAFGIAGCTDGPDGGAPTQSSSAGLADDDHRGVALEWAGRGSQHSSQLEVSQSRYDGLVVFRNVTGSPVQLISVEMATDDSTVVSVDRVGLVALAPDQADGVGFTDRFPPVFAPDLTAVDPASAELLPSDASRERYSAVFKITAVRPGLWEAPPVTVTYRSTGGVRSIDFPHRLSVCVDPASTAEC
ncbi:MULTISPECIES: hypothetical protein [unclassified Micromonospora]|uniref:hypothetical protein n=1 Tax=unclassified Micromonospora TaxID=2617518 RepID=UPI003A8923CD